MNFSEAIKTIENSANEWACGYNDSGCYYHFIKGNRGTGSMIDGIGQKESIFTWEGEFEESVIKWAEYLIDKGLARKIGDVS